MKLLPALLVCAACAHAEWPEINAKLTSKQVEIRRVVVLPAEVAFNKVGTRGSEGGVEEGEQIAEAFYTAVADAFRARGVEVLPNPLTEAKDDDARYAVADLQSRYNNVRVQLKKKPVRVEKGGYTLGERVGRFEAGAAADALVFLRGSGYLPTPGRRAIGAATMGWGASPNFNGDITIVDAHTGEVLAFLRFLRGRDMTVKTEERLAKNARDVLHDVPLPLPPNH